MRRAKPGLVPLTRQSVDVQIFCDVVERLDVLVSCDGQVYKAALDGRLHVKSYLRWNPPLRIVLIKDLAIGDAPPGTTSLLVLDSCDFHECINLDAFARARVLTFQPVEGELAVMNYRVARAGYGLMPFRVVPVIQQYSLTQVEVILTIHAQIPVGDYGANVVVRLPVPKSTVTVTCDVDAASDGQRTEFLQREKQVRWSIRRF